MEENNQSEIQQTEEKQECKQHICFKDHCWKMCLGMVVAAFLGGFLATYFVTDQMAERSYRKYHVISPRYEQKMFNHMDREFNREMKNFDRKMKRHDIDDFIQDDFAVPPMFFPEPVKIDSDINGGNYNVEVGLKPFQDDDNKINYKVVGKKLTVFGESKVDDGKNKQDISFSHDFILPENADTMNIRKERKGENLVISVPMKK